MNFYKAVHAFLWKLWWYFIIQVHGTLDALLQLVTEQKQPKGQVARFGQVAIVTGGTSGIGLYVTMQLLDSGMTVVATTQDQQFHQSENIRKLKENYRNKVHILQLELSSLKDVQKFVGKFLSMDLPLHVLVCNAGIMMCPYELTEDGFEMQLGVNYLGHAHLCNLLLHKLKETGKTANFSRIVLVTSSVHYQGTFRFDDFNSKSLYSRELAYAQSKLALVTYANYLNYLLRKEGANVTVNTVHPGVVKSGLYRHTKWYHFTEVAKLIMISLERGAQNVVFAVQAKELEGIGGLYFEYGQSKVPNSLALSRKVQKQLWEITNQLLEQ